MNMNEWRSAGLELKRNKDLPPQNTHTNVPTIGSIADHLSSVDNFDTDSELGTLSSFSMDSNSNIDSADLEELNSESIDETLNEETNKDEHKSKATPPKLESVNNETPSSNQESHSQNDSNNSNDSQLPKSQNEKNSSANHKPKRAYNKPNTRSIPVATSKIKASRNSTRNKSKNTEALDELLYNDNEGYLESDTNSGNTGSRFRKKRSSNTKGISELTTDPTLSPSNISANSEKQTQTVNTKSGSLFPVVIVDNDNNDTVSTRSFKITNGNCSDQSKNSQGASSVKTKFHEVESKTGVGAIEEAETQRINALQKLSVIEIEFAKIRESLYLQKLGNLHFEEELLKREIHPEFVSKLEELEAIKKSKIEEVKTLCHIKKMNCIRQTEVLNKCTHTSFLRNKGKLTQKMLSNLGLQLSIAKDRYAKGICLPITHESKTGTISLFHSDDYKNLTLLNQSLQSISQSTESQHFQQNKTLKNNRKTSKTKSINSEANLSKVSPSSINFDLKGATESEIEADFLAIGLSVSYRSTKKPPLSQTIQHKRKPTFNTVPNGDLPDPAFNGYEQYQGSHPGIVISQPKKKYKINKPPKKQLVTTLPPPIHLLSAGVGFTGPLNNFNDINNHLSHFSHNESTSKNNIQAISENMKNNQYGNGTVLNSVKNVTHESNQGINSLQNKPKSKNPDFVSGINQRISQETHVHAEAGTHLNSKSNSNISARNEGHIANNNNPLNLNYMHSSYKHDAYYIGHHQPIHPLVPNIILPPVSKNTTSSSENSGGINLQSIPNFNNLNRNHNLPPLGYVRNQSVNFSAENDRTINNFNGGYATNLNTVDAGLVNSGVSGVSANLQNNSQMKKPKQKAPQKEKQKINKPPKETDTKKPRKTKLKTPSAFLDSEEVGSYGRRLEDKPIPSTSSLVSLEFTETEKSEPTKQEHVFLTGDNDAETKVIGFVDNSNFLNLKNPVILNQNLNGVNTGAISCENTPFVASGQHIDNNNYLPENVTKERTPFSSVNIIPKLGNAIYIPENQVDNNTKENFDILSEKQNGFVNGNIPEDKGNEVVLSTPNMESNLNEFVADVKEIQVLTRNDIGLNSDIERNSVWKSGKERTAISSNGIITDELPKIGKSVTEPILAGERNSLDTSSLEAIKRKVDPKLIRLKSKKHNLSETPLNSEC
ncbi:hypothetical protein BB559_005056 [Furculomyces boomerangus]|uniref:Uncharacterized protein n=2 Tax=Harpellales TaxID=61421 RepID=A0A2T9YB23_9FUNG|nr:hypothetical protein BB559_005056 [Furculomyces boomerangus]PWA00016.1 hypothetical protein BB558_003896 [Smittium angustum]